MPNPYPNRFLELHWADVFKTGVTLDVGSGDRKMEGVISVDVASCCDVQGDCLALPFRDACADLVLSQAVLEHVTDPQRAVDEMRRVLRPGGLLYVQAAFVQPVHLAPRHYFNVTPHGLAWLLRDWEVLETGTTGTFDETIARLFRAVGRRRLGLVPAPPPELYALASSGVAALARRP